MSCGRDLLEALRETDNWNELNIHKPNPDFDPTWYTNHENVLQRWKMQMGKL